MRALGMGVSSSLIASAIYYWITEHRLIPALLIGAAGIAGFLITHFWTKKKPEAPLPPPPPSVHQDVKQEAIHAPINISVVGSSSTATATAPTPAPEPALRHNIKFADFVYGANEQTHVLSRFAGQTLSFATAKFENQAIKGQELLILTVKARAIYRRLDGAPILDISNVPWVPGPGNQVYETFEVNTPRYLLLFSLGYNTRFARSVESIATRIAGRSRTVPNPHNYEIREPVGTVEVQLLTHTEKVYAVLLHLLDSDMGLLPRFERYEEL